MTKFKITPGFILLWNVNGQIRDKKFNTKKEAKDFSNKVKGKTQIIKQEGGQIEVI